MHANARCFFATDLGTPRRARRLSSSVVGAPPRGHMGMRRASQEKRSLLCADFPFYDLIFSTFQNLFSRISSILFFLFQLRRVFTLMRKTARRTVACVGRFFTAYLAAMHSISSFAPFGMAATCTQLRTGKGALKKDS